MKKIKDKTIYFFHTVALTTLFVLGQFIITIPFIKDFGNILSCVICAILGLVFCFFTLPIIKRVISLRFVKFFIALFSAFVLANTFALFCEFASIVLYENIVFTVVLLLGICAYFGFKSKEAILKFSLICFIYSVIVLSIFIVLLSPNFEFQNITFQKGIEFSEILNVWEIFFSAILVGMFSFLVIGTSQRRAVITGYIIGTAILLIVAIATILVFGSEFSANIKYPFLRVVSTVAIGKLFSRMDAFIYPIFLFCSLIRIEVCVFIIKFCFSKKVENEKNY